MGFKGKGLNGIFALAIVAAALTGCGGSSTSSTDSAAGASSSVGPAVNSAAGTIALSSASYQAPAASSAVVTIYRSGTSTGDASVAYTTVNGSALAGTDYTATSGTLTWTDGDSTSRVVVIPVAASASGKVFAIALTNVEGQAAFGSPSSATIQVSPQSATVSSTSSSGSTVAATTSSSTGSSSGSTVASGSSSGSSAASSSSGSSSSSGTTTSTKTAALSWSAPTENTNGSALTNLVGYNIYYGTSTSAMTSKISISTVGVTNYVIQNMTSGNWYFAMTAINASGAESALTGAIEATL